MGGEAGVASVEGVGSTFWFTARLRKGRQLAPGAAASPAEPAEAVLRRKFTGTRVLLAEDNEINQEVAVSLLGDAGLVVDVAEDGALAVQRAAAGTYALILMDMQMPNMSGVAERVPGVWHERSGRQAF